LTGVMIYIIDVLTLANKKSGVRTQNPEGLK
jgi:hypothetical protein